MHIYNGKLVELPNEGKAIVVTDLHGNLKDYKKYIDIWEKYKEENIHFILTGDLFMLWGERMIDLIDILESIKQKCETNENFHPLLGNHEWSTISRTSVYKRGVNQSLNFEALLKEYLTKDGRIN